MAPKRIGIAGVYARQLGALGHEHGTIALVVSLLAVAAGIVLAYRLYAAAPTDSLTTRLGQWGVAMAQRFYVDEFYQRTVIRLQDTLAQVADWLDRWVIAGLLVRGVQGTVSVTGRVLRLVQTGNLQTYAFLLILGAALMLYYVLG